MLRLFRLNISTLYIFLTTNTENPTFTSTTSTSTTTSGNFNKTYNVFEQDDY